MAGYYRSFGSDYPSALFEGGDIVSQVLQGYYFGANTFWAHAFIEGVEDIVVASASAYILGRLPVEHNYRQFGEERITSSLIYGNNILSRTLDSWVFPEPNAWAHAFIEGREPGNVLASAPAYIEGRAPIEHDHLILGNQDERLTTSLFYITSGEAVSNVASWMLSMHTASAHAYIRGKAELSGLAHAFLRAQDYASASASAFIRGEDYLADVAHAFIEGIPPGTFVRGFAHAFARGKDTAFASAHAYIKGQESDIFGPALWTS